MYVYVFCYLKKNPLVLSSLYPKKSEYFWSPWGAWQGHTHFWQKLKLLEKATKVSYFSKINFASSSLWSEKIL